MTMLLYHLHTLAERFCERRAARKAARRMNALLRGHGFVETAPGVWRKTMVLRPPYVRATGPCPTGHTATCGESLTEKQAPRLPR
jgi:hypothetical protein